MRKTNLKSRIQPGETVVLTVTEEIPPGQQIVITFGNGGRAAREHSFEMPEVIKFAKTDVDSDE
jgi:hypothetical protein